MNLYHILRAGKDTLFLILFLMTIVFLSAFFIGKLLKTEKKSNVLIGVGTAICGGSAIAAVAPVIGADNEEIARSISTIFLFNIIAAFLFPFIGYVLNLSDVFFGFWAGLAINDTSSVVAAGYTYSEAAGDIAVIVKLTRTLMIIPVTLILALYVINNKARAAGRAEGVIAGSQYPSGDRAQYSSGDRAFNIKLVKIIPWFVFGFIAASLINTFLPLPPELQKILVQAGRFLIVAAMAGIGLNTNLVKLFRNETKLIILGMFCWIILVVISFVFLNFLAD